MSAIEIHISAERLVRDHGAEAWARSADHAEASAARGDWSGVTQWRRVGAAIRQLQQRGGSPCATRERVAHWLTASLTGFAGRRPTHNHVFG